MSLEKMSIAGRLQALIGLVALSGVGTGTALYFANASQQKALETERDAQETALDVEAISNLALDMRRQEKDFLLNKDLSHIEEFDLLSEDAISKLEALAGNSEIKSTVNQYAKDYTDLVEQLVQAKIQLGLNEKIGLEGRLRSSVHAAEEHFSVIENDTLLAKMLMMRRHEKDFMMRVDPKYVARLDQRVIEFKDILSKQDLPGSFKLDMIRLIESYQGDFHKWTDTRLSVHEITQEVENAYAKLNTAIEELKTQILNDTKNSIADSDARRQLSLWGLLSLLFGIFFTITILTALIGRSIRNPLRRMTNEMLALSDLSADPETNTGREIAAMQSALEIFRQNREEAEILRRETAESEKRAKQQRMEERRRIVNDLEDVMGALLMTVSDSSDRLEKTSHTLQHDAEMSGSEAKSAARAARETALAAEAMSQASSELSASIHEILRQAGQSQETGRKAVGDTEALKNTVQNLKNAVGEIVEVVSLINNIAEQTNLLSLNATIEAARAGEAGKGFAVVATEVKQLADQTAKSTSTVSERIQGIHDAVDLASRAISNVVAHIDDMSGMADQIVGAVETQRLATEDIAQKVSEATRKSEEVASTISGLSDRVEQTHTHADSVFSAANDLTQNAATMKTDTHAYLQRLANS